jgi:hypothetical protein
MSFVYDGGSTIYDYFIISLLSTIISAVVVVNLSLWRERKNIALRAKSLHLVTTQTIAGVIWFVSFTIRNGVSSRLPLIGLAF